MIQSDFFYSQLKAHKTDFFCGVPDSLLKDFCAFLQDNDTKNNIITANEGAAVGLAIGVHLATGKIPLVYMQNSGLGNTVNPLLSLAAKQVYNVPMVLLVGWRGMPGVKDEPQHKKQGSATLSLLDAMSLPYIIMAQNQDELKQQIEYCYSVIKQEGGAFAFVIKKGTFAPYTLQNKKKDISDLTREAAIECIIQNIDKNSPVVSTTGMISRELFELRQKYNMLHNKDFLTVGGMGHAGQIALGISLSKPKIKTVCIEGDGAVLMHTGSLAITASQMPNMLHIVLNNAAHDSVGGQPTVADKIDLCEIAKACGYKKVAKVCCIEGVKKALQDFTKDNSLCFLEVQVKKGNRPDLGRPTTTPIQNKTALMEFLQNL